MPTPLVVYFSRTGTTRTVAEAIAALCHADIEGIREQRSRTGVWGYLRSAREALRRRAVEIEPPTRDPADYDLVVLGTPVWASNVSSPLRAYMTQHKGQLRRVAFFCTQGGSGATSVLQDMSALCGQPPIATLALKESDVRAGRHSQSLQQFVESLTAPART
jgi:flavodoxin